jgi:hypothetical protein
MEDQNKGGGEPKKSVSFGQLDRIVVVEKNGDVSEVEKLPLDKLGRMKSLLNKKTRHNNK